MNRKFNITMHVPLGIRCGTLSIKQDQNIITGILDILGRKTEFLGSINKNDIFEFTGDLITPLLSFPFSAKGKITNNTVNFKLKGNRYLMTVTGKEIR